jgi:cobalt-zinc-cadmium efflux system outer membrane protein
MVRHVAYKLLCLATIFPLFLAWAEAYAVDSGTPAYRLEEIIQLALTRHPALAGAQGALEQSRGQQVAAKAFLNPTVDGRGGRGAIRDPDNGISINEVYVTVSQPLEWLGKRAARQRAAEAGFVGATAGIEEVRLNVIAEVKIAFYDLLLTQRGVEIVQGNLAALEEVAHIAKIRVRTGEAPRFEAVKADVEVLKARQDLARARNAVRLGRITLDSLTAGGLGQMFSIQGDFRPFENGPALESLTARMLELHPTLRRLRKLIDRADFAVLT